MAISLESKIEGLLFYKGEEMSIDKLSQLLGASEDEIKESLTLLEKSLENRGIILMRKDDSVALGISSELGKVIESIRKEELSKDLSKATLETLSIILYRNGVSRGEIDYIRGVNSSFILRNLLIRGLIEKITDPIDSRRFLYRPTLDILSYMGVASIDQLPNYQEVNNQLQEVINQVEKHD